MTTLYQEKPPFILVNLTLLQQKKNTYPSFLLELERLKIRVQELEWQLKHSQNTLAEKEIYAQGLAADLEHTILLLNHLHRESQSRSIF